MIREVSVLGGEGGTLAARRGLLKAHGCGLGSVARLRADESIAVPAGGGRANAQTMTSESGSEQLPSFRLNGRIAVITGASEGIGRAFALGFSTRKPK